MSTFTVAISVWTELEQKCSFRATRRYLFAKEVHWMTFFENFRKFCLTISGNFEGVMKNSLQWIRIEAKVGKTALLTLLPAKFWKVHYARSRLMYIVTLEYCFTKFWTSRELHWEKTFFFFNIIKNLELKVDKISRRNRKQRYGSSCLLNLNLWQFEI